MTLSKNNAFSPGFCTLTGQQRISPKLPNANQFTKPTTAYCKYGIVIPQQADADRRQTFRKSTI